VPARSNGRGIIGFAPSGSNMIARSTEILATIPFLMVVLFVDSTTVYQRLLFSH
jgi:hypothetical protein